LVSIDLPEKTVLYTKQAYHMSISKQFLMVLVVAALTFSCSPTKGRKAIVVDDYGRSMRFDGGRAESKSKSWNNTKSVKKQRKARTKAFKSKRRN
jgi:hypothetical protein